MQLRTIEKLIETSRLYFSLPMPESGKSESQSRHPKPARAGGRSTTSTRHEKRLLANNRSLLW